MFSKVILDLLADITFGVVDTGYSRSSSCSPVCVCVWVGGCMCASEKGYAVGGFVVWILRNSIESREGGLDVEVCPLRSQTEQYPLADLQRTAKIYEV